MLRALCLLTLLVAAAVSGEGGAPSDSGGTTVPTQTVQTGDVGNGTSTAATNNGPGVTTAPTPESTTPKSDPLPTTTQPTASTTTQPTATPTTEGMGFINALDFDNDQDETTAPPATTSVAPLENTTMSTLERKERLSDQIRNVIKHYKEFGTVTVPDASVPDPMSIPNIIKNIGGNEITFTNTKVYGMSNFTIEHVNTDLDKMQVFVSIYFKRLVILGNYTAKMFFKKVSGPFNTTLLYVEASGAAALIKDKDGNLQASQSEMDMTFMESVVKFGNMGIMGTLLQGVVASAGPILFESIKPFVLTEINNKVREDVNKKIKTIGTKFLESGAKPPLDVALEEGRKYVRENGYDPYFIESYVWKYIPKNQNISLLKVNVSRLSLVGLSNFRRVGEVSLSMDSGTIQMTIHLATSKLRGQCKWSVGIGKFVRNGQTNFTVDYVQGRGVVNQSLDTSQHPMLEDLDVNVGKVRVQVKGTGAFDFILQAVVNTLPDLIRHTIVDAIELPLKYGMQQILNDIKVEEIVEKQLPELDKMGL